MFHFHRDPCIVSKSPCCEVAVMRDPYEVLQKKEQEITRVRKEVEALQIVARLLAEESPANGESKVDLKKVVDVS